MAVLPQSHGGEAVFVADWFSLREFNGQTGRNKGTDYAIGPLTVSPDGGNLVLTDGSSVQVWNPATHTMVEQYWDFGMPLNAIRFQGDLVVIDLMTGSVVRRDSADNRIPLASNLTLPIGLAATNDDLWVSD